MPKYKNIFDIKQEVHDMALVKVYERIPKEDLRGIYIAGSILFSVLQKPKDKDPNDIDYIMVVDDFSDATLFGYTVEIAEDLTEIYEMPVDCFIQGKTIFNYLVEQPELLPYYVPCIEHFIPKLDEGFYLNQNVNHNRNWKEQKALAKQHQERNRGIYNGTGVL